MHRLSRHLTSASTAIGGVALVVMTLAIVTNVFGRILWDSPFYGMVEIVSLSGVFLIACAVGFAEKHRTHLVITILTDHLPKRLKSFLSVVGLISNLVVVAMLVYSGYRIAIEDWITPGATTYVLHLNKGPFRFVWVVGGVLLFFFIVEHIVEILKKAVKK